MGRELVAAIKKRFPGCRVTAVGTNANATQAMHKAGADAAATGENPVIVACRSADVIVGPIGIVIADSLMGEVTPLMATAVGQSRAKRLLVPVNICDNTVVGVPDLSISVMIENVLKHLSEYGAT